MVAGDEPRPSTAQQAGALSIAPWLLGPYRAQSRMKTFVTFAGIEKRTLMSKKAARPTLTIKLQQNCSRPQWSVFAQLGQKFLKPLLQLFFGAKVSNVFHVQVVDQSERSIRLLTMHSGSLVTPNK